jgi:hypothetical protein
MEAQAATYSPFRELAQRISDGHEVVLLWHESTNELAVTVSDARSGAYFELAAAPDQALDIFHHPYAYAASRGMPYEEELLASWAQATAYNGSNRTSKPYSEPIT